MPVSITGRNSTHVEFFRLTDSKFFSISLDKLSSEDRKFVKTLTLKKTPDDLIPKISKRKPAYIQTRLEQIVRLEADIVSLKMEIKGEASNPGMLRQHTRQITEKNLEILELRQAIEDYRH